MNISKHWKELKRFFNKKFGQQELDFTAPDETKIIAKEKPLALDAALIGLLSVPPLKREKK